MPPTVTVTVPDPSAASPASPCSSRSFRFCHRPVVQLRASALRQHQPRLVVVTSPSLVTVAARCRRQRRRVSVRPVTSTGCAVFQFVVERQRVLRHAQVGALRPPHRHRARRASPCSSRSLLFVDSTSPGRRRRHPQGLGHRIASTRVRHVAVSSTSSSWPAVTSTGCAVFQFVAERQRVLRHAQGGAGRAAYRHRHRHLAGRLRRRLTV